MDQTAGDVVPVRQSVGQIVTFVRNTVFRNRWTKGITGFWLLGLLVAFALPAPVPITEDMAERFAVKASDAAHKFDRPVNNALSELYHAEDAYRASRVRFPAVQFHSWSVQTWCS